ncbi:MAG: tetratricopeptide repeat protein [Cytophagales bacterium]|nr:tetratricopeptide repeat protein [Cytophagales bacterium]
MKRVKLIFVVFILFFVSGYAQFSKKKKAVGDVYLTPIQQSEYDFAEGMKEYLLENYIKALLYFEKSITNNPNGAGTHYMIGQIYVKQGNLYKALEYIKKAVEINDSNKYYYLLLAQVYERKQDFNEAAKTYLNLINKVPNCQEYYYELATINLIQGKNDEALKNFDKFEKATGISEELVRQKQQIYLKQGKLEEAIKEGKRLIAAYPDDPRSVLLLAELLLTNEKYAECEKILTELLAKNPDDPYAQLYMSDIYRNKGDEDKADKALEKVFKSEELSNDIKVNILINKIRQFSSETDQDRKEKLKYDCLNLSSILTVTHPKDSKSWAMNGDVLAICGKSNDALLSYLKAVSLDYSQYKVWQQVLTLDHELNKTDSLKKHSEKSLEYFPNNAVFWFYNGLAYQLMQDYRRSITSFEQGKKYTTGDKNMLVQFCSMIGDCYNSLKEYKKSDDAFEEALKEDANNHLVLNNYSYYLSLRNDKMDYAKKMSEKVVKEYPDNPTYLDTYAWILYMMKEYEKAKEIFEKIESKTNNGTIVEHYGDVLFKLGEKDKAVEQWKRAKALGETSEWIDKKISDRKIHE